MVDLDALLRETDTLLRRAVGETIEISFETAPELWPSEVDAAQFEAAIMNLVVNARDAMPKGGKLVLVTGNTTVGAAEGGLDLPIGDYVVLAVRDTGEGMPREVLAHAFEPFFTTKEVGKGSGWASPWSMVSRASPAAPSESKASRVWAQRCGSTCREPILCCSVFTRQTMSWEIWHDRQERFGGRRQ